MSIIIYKIIESFAIYFGEGFSLLALAFRAVFRANEMQAPQDALRKRFSANYAKLRGFSEFRRSFLYVFDMGRRPCFHVSHSLFLSGEGFSLPVYF